MCGICAALRPYDPDCPYTGVAATAAQRVLSHLDTLGIEIADAAALFGDPIALQNTLPIDPWQGIGFPERDPTAITSFFDVPSGPSTSFYISPGMRLNAEISWAGDTDWFGMQLQQGQTYQISLTSLPFFGLGDPQLYLFDNNANLLLIDDNSGGGVNALLTITATRTGVYFIGATGFGGGGNTTGGYQISLSQVNFAADTVGDTRGSATRIEVNAPVTGSIDFIGDGDMYRVRIEKGKSYYAVLDALPDRLNPLGDPRLQLFDRDGNLLGENDDNGITRNSFLSFDATVTGDVFLRAEGVGSTTGDFRLSVVELQPPPAVDLLEGIDWNVQFDKTRIRYYFADIGESVMEEITDSAWTSYEKGQARAALTEFANISGLTFVETASRAQADFVLGKGFLDSPLSGKMAPQDPGFAAIAGEGWFNTNPEFWSDRAGGLLEPGAYGYKNFVHEFGHGLGLSHPHDNGGGSILFPGVRGPGDLGDRNMNQEIWTAMSYINGWRAGPEGGSGTLSFGIAMGPMAFDIAVIQRKYGANMTFATGNDSYTLVARNERGTGYKAIWDAGGRDSINHEGKAEATIDLRPATLKFEEVGGGGFVSWVKGIFGGFTIANGVVIEDARGGGGADAITGNAAANVLRGNNGRDSLTGLAGNDRLLGGARHDTLTGGSGDDTLDGGADNDILTGGRGADAFVFARGHDRDRVMDFNGADGDRLLLDTDLWSGQTLTRTQVVQQLAAVVGNRMVFDFGDGDVLELQGITSKAGLADFLVFA
jgi:Ca2+-binding RTX toxin-like protein